jgi:hypothetical protein
MTEFAERVAKPCVRDFQSFWQGFGRLAVRLSEKKGDLIRICCRARSLGEELRDYSGGRRRGNV